MIFKKTRRFDLQKEKLYHLVCKQIQDWKEIILEMETKMEEVPVDDEFKEKLKNLKKNFSERVCHLNNVAEDWQQEILKEYGIYTKNRE